MKRIDFYFDFISPYAYVAWFRMQDVATKNACTLHAIPVLFAGLLRAHETKGPAETPAKRRYLFKDVYRKAHRQRLAFAPPPSHPFNPLPALRAVTSVKTDRDRIVLVSALYDEAWGKGHTIDSLEAVATIATNAGLDGHAIANAAQEASIKDALKRNTDDAIEAGIFGVPTMVVDREMFWGVDAIEALEEFLAGKDPFQKPDVNGANAAFEKWIALPATTSRK